MGARRKFTDEFKREAVKLATQPGVTCWDNAAMESFFSSLKTERISRKHYATCDTARADVFDYIERFYNPRKRHSVLGYLSPAQFEEKMVAL